MREEKYRANVRQLACEQIMTQAFFIQYRRKTHFQLPRSRCGCESDKPTTSCDKLINVKEGGSPDKSLGNTNLDLVQRYPSMLVI